MREFQIKSLQSQMNPHFMGNTLNAIQGMVNQGQKEESIESIQQLSELVRNYLDFSRGNTFFIPLHEELKFLKIYTNLEKMRFGDRFDIELKVGETVDTNIEIPPMLIQPFVENAIKHGLENRQGKGKVSIEIHQTERELICQIKDNGIGIQNAKKRNANKSKSRNSLSF